MLIKDMMTHYNETKAALIGKINGLRNVPEPRVYDYINELDEINEELNLLNTTMYDVPVDSEDLIVIEHEGQITVPDMIKNISELEGYSVATFNFLKQVSSGGYTGFIEKLDQINERVDKTILYQENKVSFGETELSEEDSKIKLSTPVLELDAEGNKVKWAKVVNADSYAVSYKEASGEPQSFTAVLQELAGEFSISLAEISEPGSYTVTVVAKTSNTDAFIDSEAAESAVHTVLAPIIPLTVEGLAVDQGMKKVSWNVNENAQSYMAKVKDYPIPGSDFPLTQSILDGVVSASLTGITAVGTWTVEVIAIGDGVVYETSVAATDSYIVLAPAVPVTLNSLSMELSPSKDAFTFDPCPETDDVVYTETSGIDPGKYTLEKTLDSITFAITEEVLDGESIIPTIKAVPNDKTLFLDSDEMVGKEVGRVAAMPTLTSVLQDGLDLYCVIPQLGETGEPNAKSLTVTITDSELEEQVIVVGIEDLTYDYDIDESVRIANFNALLTNLGFIAEDEVSLSIVNTGEGEWTVDSEAAEGVFTIEE